MRINGILKTLIVLREKNSGVMIKEQVGQKQNKWQDGRLETFTLKVSGLFLREMADSRTKAENIQDGPRHILTIRETGQRDTGGN